jgi:hypothetical protein
LDDDLTMEIDDLIGQLEAEAAAVRALIPFVSGQLRYLAEGNLQSTEVFTKHPTLDLLKWGLRHIDELPPEQKSLILQKRAEWVKGAKTQLETLQMLEQSIKSA